MSAPFQPERGKPLRLHLGGHETREGWTLVNAQARPGVDVVTNVMDLSMFADGTVDEAYASHVYEHLGYKEELPRAIKEVHRILKPGGLFRVAVPDLDMLARMFISPKLTIEERFYVMRMIMGGQADEYDFHKTGFNLDLLGMVLHTHGFESIRRVPTFGLFNDTSNMNYLGANISLNVQCTKKA